MKESSAPTIGASERLGARGRGAWILVLASCWLLGVVHTYRAGFNPGLLTPLEQLQPPLVPWSGVLLTMGQTLLYTLAAYAIVRDGSTRGIGIALLAALGVHAMHVVGFGTDAPDYTYVPMRYSLLLAAVFLVAVTKRWLRG